MSLIPASVTGTCIEERLTKKIPPNPPPSPLQCVPLAWLLHCAIYGDSGDENPVELP